VGVEDDFFALGGHSLRATQVVSRLRAVLGVELPLRDFFADPTVAGLARRIERQAAVPVESIARRPAGSSPPPLSFSQQRFWLLDRLEPGNPAYNIPAAIRLLGSLDPELLRRALEGVASRHEALRTTFREEGGRPVQMIDPEARLDLPVLDLSSASEKEVEELGTAEARRSFDLAAGPLLRAVLLRLGEDHHVLLLTLHHIVSDGWSMGVLVGELAALYRGLADGVPASLPELPIQYADFAVWQREWLAGERMEAQLAYWRRTLQGLLDPLPLPLDRPRPARRSPAGAFPPLVLDAAATAPLRDLALRQGATLFMVLLAGLHALLGRLSGAEDVAVGTPVANRTRAEVSGLIGIFLNMLVMRGDLSGQPTFEELVDRVRKGALGAYDHQDLPFERLVEDLKPERDASRTPLFQVLFALQNTPVPAIDLGGLRLSGIDLDPGATQFDLQILLRETPEGGVAGVLGYRTDVFDAATLERLSRQLGTLLAGAVGDPHLRLSELPVLSAAERHQLVSTWNDTRTDLGPPACLHQLFAAQAARTPEAPAVLWRGGSWSYRELDRRAAALARRLAGRGIGLGDRVAILLEPAPERVAAVLAVLRTGAAYVPLDPTYPRGRLDFMVEDSGASLLLVAEGWEGSFGVPALEVTEEDSEGPSPAVADPEAPAYVIYTSGSTGRPKGVVIRHEAAANTVLDVNQRFGVGPGDRLLAVSSLGFDLSVYDLFGPLAAGGAVVLPEPAAAPNPVSWAESMARHGVTIWDSAPPLMDLLLSSGAALPPTLRLALLSGDWIPLGLPGQIRRQVPEAEIVSLGGATEASIWSILFPIPVGEVAPGWASIPYGRPMANQSFHVLDAAGEVAPVGVVGELHIGGLGVADGYHDRPALTAERFVPDPFAGRPGARLYRTGDLGRRFADGVIELLGRLDHQVKVRGFRIELGEVEAALLGQPQVREAVALVVTTSGGDRRLAACVVPERDAVPSAAELRAALGEGLPAYMVPSAVVFLDSFPLTPNGKLDRRELARLAAGAVPEGGEAEPPRTPAEVRLAGLWAEVLGIDPGVRPVSRSDNFFELGGHSLLAIQLTSRVRDAFGVELPLLDVFESPELAALAAAIEGAGRATTGAAPSLRPVPRSGGPLPLSLSQERLWFLDRLTPGTAVYNIPGAFLLRGPLDAGLLERSFAAVVRRHESLRTRFVELGGVPAQVVDPPGPLPLPWVDLQALPAPVRGPEAERLLAEEAARPFDLERGPLLRTLLVRLAADEHVLGFNMHHVVSDGWSVGVLFRDLTVSYEALALGLPPALPDLPVQYADFAAWQRERLSGPELAAHLAYWRERLAGHPGALDLPLDRPRPAVRTSHGATVRTELPAVLSARLNALGLAERASLFMVLLAGFKLLLSRLSGQDDILVGTPIAGRDRPQLEGLIGFFLNTLVLRTDTSGSPTFRELLRRVREAALGAYAHQEVPFERLLEEIKPERDLSRTPLFQVFFNMLNLPVSGAVLPGGLEIEAVSREGEEAKFDLTVYASEVDGAVRLDLVYNAVLFDRGRMEELLRQYQGLLAQIAENPDDSVDRVSLLTPEAAAVLPGPTAPLGDEWVGAVHELFAAEARRQPERPAVEDAEGTWTYGELADAVDRLAGHLLASGVGRGDRVAIHAHRGAPLVWAVLATLRAGAAFTILDPVYPAPRTLDTLRLAEPRAFLAIAAAGEPAPEVSDWLDAAGLACRLTLPGGGPAGAAELLAGLPPGAPEVQIGADDLALVAFTSGSTGRPKGILGRHGPLSHFLPWQSERFGLDGADRYSMLSGLAHDPLQRDIFTALCLGGTICIPTAEEIATPGRLAAWMARSAVTVAHLTPAMGQILTEPPGGGAEPASIPSLRWALLVGDVLTRLDVERIRRLAPGVTCVNLYGSTETQRAVGHHVAGDQDGGLAVLPLGKGIQDVQLLILTRAGQLAGIGEVGELAVRSPHLAAGYLGDEALTRERFAPNPFTGRAGDRIYRTGDLGRYLPNGEAIFAGRADAQVKIRGFRIELGEIEAALGRLPGVREAVVVAREDAPDPGGKRLVAYVVPDPDRLNNAGVAALRDALLATLPFYMVPAAFVLLPRLPVTPNGKVDRKALPEPSGERPDVGAAYEPPVTETEQTLAGLWTALLKVEKAGLGDDFFALGGHSLLATQMVARVRDAFAVELPLAAVFQEKTLGRLAACIDRERGTPKAVSPISTFQPRRRSRGADQLAARVESLSDAEVQELLRLKRESLEEKKPE
jgi:amino acid adenylation domain-containing protein